MTCPTCTQARLLDANAAAFAANQLGAQQQLAAIQNANYPWLAPHGAKIVGGLVGAAQPPEHPTWPNEALKRLDPPPHDSVDEAQAPYWGAKGVERLVPAPKPCDRFEAALGRVRMNDPLPGDERLIVEENLRLQDEREFLRAELHSVEGSRDFWKNEAAYWETRLKISARELRDQRAQSMWSLIWDRFLGWFA